MRGLAVLSRRQTTFTTFTDMPINRPDTFCFKVQIAEKTTVESDDEFDSIGQIKEVPGTPCTE